MGGMGVSADMSCDTCVVSTEPCHWAVAGMHGGRFSEPLVMLQAAVLCLHSWGSDPHILEPHAWCVIVKESGCAVRRREFPKGNVLCTLSFLPMQSVSQARLYHTQCAGGAHCGSTLNSSHSTVQCREERKLLRVVLY